MMTASDARSSPDRLQDAYTTCDECYVCEAAARNGHLECLRASAEKLQQLMVEYMQSKVKGVGASVPLPEFLRSVDEFLRRSSSGKKKRENAKK